jgi:NAD(P)H-binding
MRVFVAGGAGAVGRPLVAQLVARGHEVTATTTSPAKLDLLAQLGAEGVVMDGLDAASVGEAVAKARPDAIVHEMTGPSVAHAGKPDTKHFDRWFATTNRLRTEGTDHLLAAAEATGVSHFVAQSYSGWNGIRKGGWVKTEEDPLDPALARMGRDPRRDRSGRRRDLHEHPSVRRVGARRFHRAAHAAGRDGDRDRVAGPVRADHRARLGKQLRGASLWRSPSCSCVLGAIRAAPARASVVVPQQEPGLRTLQSGGPTS